MLTTVDAPAHPRVVHIDVTDTTLRLALSFVAEDAGWVRGDRERAEIVVSNQLHSATAEQPVDVLVVSPHPAPCQAGVRAVAHGCARVLLSADDPEQLPAALQAASSGLVQMPKRLVDAANQAPPLDDRLVRTLLLVAGGSSNVTIARAMHESESTAKRDVATLMRLLSVRCRAELAQTAIRLGYRMSGTPSTTS